MVRAAKAAPAPEPEDDAITIYAEIVGALTDHDPSFKVQGKTESEQQYYKRILEALNDISEEAWQALSDSAQQWVNKGIAAINNSKAIAACGGFVALPPAKAAAGKAAPKKAAKPEPEEEEEEEEAEEEAEEEEEAPPPKKAGRPAKAAPVKAAPAKPARKKAAPVEEEEAEEEEEEEETEEEEAPPPKKGKTAPAKPAAKAAFGGKKAAPFQAKDPKLSVTYQIRKILVKTPDLDIEKVRARLTKLGFEDVKTSTVSTLRTDIAATIKAAKEVGVWGDA